MEEHTCRKGRRQPSSSSKPIHHYGDSLLWACNIVVCTLSKPALLHVYRPLMCSKLTCLYLIWTVVQAAIIHSSHLPILYLRIPCSPLCLLFCWHGTIRHQSALHKA